VGGKDIIIKKPNRICGVVDSYLIVGVGEGAKEEGILSEEDYY